jgi:hypothetical protein
MTKILTLSVLALITLLLNSSVAADLSGGGEWRSLRGESIRGTWSASLVRSGDGLRGTFDLDGSNVFRRGEVEGSISGEDVVLGIVAEGQEVASFTGRLGEGGTVSGEWECEALGDSGVWEGSLRPGVEPVR